MQCTLHYCSAVYYVFHLIAPLIDKHLTFNIISADDKKTTVNISKQLRKLQRKVKSQKRLVAKSSTVGLPFVMNFISECLSKNINHRNHLQHYRNTI